MATYRLATFTVKLEVREQERTAPMRSSEDVSRIARSLYETLDADKEHFSVFVLNNKNRYQGFKVLSTGSLTASLVHPREVLTAVLCPEWRAAAVVFVHNHPSGEPNPSQEDQEITRRLKELLDTLGIRFLDHVVIGTGTDRYYSFSDHGLL